MLKKGSGKRDKEETVAETQTSGRSPLQSERGTTTIRDAVVTSIAGLAVDEVSGVEQEVPGTRLPGDTSPTMGELFGRVTGSGRGARRVSVEVGETQAAVDLTVTVPYGRSIPEVTKAIRDTVIQRVENLTGLEVTEVNITVKDVFFPEQR
jgi:uncharacterized alkaline shock family protein YloU